MKGAWLMCDQLTDDGCLSVLMQDIAVCVHYFTVDLMWMPLLSFSIKSVSDTVSCGESCLSKSVNR